MWIALALLAAVTSGISVIFQKKGTVGDSIYQISAVNIVAMFVTVLLVALASGSYRQLGQVTASCWYLTIASGVVQAGSWVAYFLALKEANISFLMVLDKINIIVTMILAYFLIGEKITFIMVLGSILILGGTALMAELKGGFGQIFNSRNRWMLWGLLSPTLQAVSNILVKMDTTMVDTTLTTTIRMLIVAVILSFLAFIKEGSPKKLKQLGRKNLLLIICGGVVLGVSYLFMYRAIYLGVAAVVTPIIKANFLVTTLLAYIVFHERLSHKGVAGFILVCIGVALFVI